LSEIKINWPPEGAKSDWADFVVIFRRKISPKSQNKEIEKLRKGRRAPMTEPRRRSLYVLKAIHVLGC
jgi:hypothetical protein